MNSNCEKCGGTGFIFSLKDGKSGAEKCECKTKKKQEKQSKSLLIGRDEMNLCEVALCDFGARQANGKHTVLAREVTLPNGYKIAITADGHSQLGLPTPADMDLMVVLQQISKRTGFPEEVEFDPPELLDLLGYKREKAKGNKFSGRVYEQRREGFKRLKALTFSQWDGWFDNNQKKPTCVGQFSLIDRWWWPTEEELRKGANSKCYLAWGKPVLESMKTGFVKSLNLEAYWALNDPIARFVYRYADRHLYRRNHHSVTTPCLYKNILGLRWNNDSPEMMAKVLINHLSELEEKVGIKPTVDSVETKFRRVK